MSFVGGLRNILNSSVDKRADVKLNSYSLIQGAPTDLVDTTGSITVAVMLNRVVLTQPSAPRNNVTDSAVNIVAGLNNPVVGESIEFYVINSGASTSTLTAGAGVTVGGVGGSNVVASGISGKFMIRVTNVGTPACVLYRLA